MVQAPCGGDKRDRTADLLTASQALSQLSYTPMLLCNCCSYCSFQIDCVGSAIDC